MSFSNNFTDTNPFSKDKNFDVRLFGDEQFLNFGNPYNFDSDAAITEQGGSDAYNVDPSTEGYVNQVGYQGCTLLDVFGSQFATPCTLYTERPYENSDASGSHSC